MIKYFVSYVCWGEDDNRGFGNAEVHLNQKIEGIEDIRALQKQIIQNYPEKKMRDVMVLNYQMI